MRLIGFDFDKISVEKLSEIKDFKDLKINTNINVAEIESFESDMLKLKEDLLKVKFSYKINYNPDFAVMELAGNVILAMDNKMSKNVLKEWKDKKINSDFQIPLFNIILRKSNIKALQLEEEMNLPLHLSLPFLKKENKQVENK